MTWDVPVKDRCPSCGKSMFKLSGRGSRKPFCVNESCANFVPEEQRGYKKKSPEEKAAAAKKPAEKKSAAKKTAAKKPAAKKAGTKKSPAKKTGKE